MKNPRGSASATTSTRREALRSLVVLSASFALPAIAGCSKKPSCSDITSLSPDEARTRNDIATYTEVAPDASKKCNLCAQFQPAPSANACGQCKVVKGPINPEG
jgi:hypothetical protein